jgi:hypothetical protein
MINTMTSPLTVDAYWGAGELKRHIYSIALISFSHAALLKRLIDETGCNGLNKTLGFMVFQSEHDY